jgi:hypothetical protein
VPHAGICAGGRSKERSLPRTDRPRRAHDNIALGAAQISTSVHFKLVRNLEDV